MDSAHRECRFNEKIGSQDCESYTMAIESSLFSEPRILFYKLGGIDEMICQSSNILQWPLS